MNHARFYNFETRSLLTSGDGSRRVVRNWVLHWVLRGCSRQMRTTVGIVSGKRIFVYNTCYPPVAFFGANFMIQF